MTVQTLTSLIDKQDNFEIVRDQIAGILVAEVENQMVLAQAGLQDPNLWKLDVYTERANPWDKWLNAPSNPADTVPIVNVWYDNGQFPENRGGTVNVQGHNTTYNIDILGYGASKSDGATGHITGDKSASLEAQRGLRLVRNILMSALNVNLQLKGLVSKRWVQSITAFQPSQDTQAAQNILGIRMAFEVWMVETSPQFTPTDLEGIFTEITRDGDGKILLQAEYDYITPP